MLAPLWTLAWTPDMCTPAEGLGKAGGASSGETRMREQAEKSVKSQACGHLLPASFPPHLTGG